MEEALEDATEPRALTGGRTGGLSLVAIGGSLAVYGIRRRSLGGIATAVAGGWLAYRGVRTVRAERRAVERGGGGSGESTDSSDGAVVEETITVGLPPEECTEYWVEAGHLGRLLGEFGDVRPAGEDHLRWTAEGPLGRRLEWEARLAEERPGERVRWESLEGAPIRNEWTVTFEPAPGDRGTTVSLRIRFDPPAGPVGDRLLNALGIVPETLAATVLDRFKSLAETGEIPTLRANPSARGSGDLA